MAEPESGMGTKETKRMKNGMKNLRGAILAVALISLLAAAVNTAAGQDAAAPSPGAGDAAAAPEASAQEDRSKSLEEMSRELEMLKHRLADVEKKLDNKIAEDKNSLKFSGFFDVSISNYKNQANIFQLGDFELDISHTFKNHFQVAAALVFNKGAELGVGFIDYHIYGGAISPRGRLFSEKGLHIQVGKFDVPFGNDWQHFTSIDRLTVTPPLTTEIIMEGGYNDVGLRFLANFMSFNFTIYALRGIEEGYSYGGNSFGARFGFTPFDNPYRFKSKIVSMLDVGISYIHDFDKNFGTAEMILAVDLETKLGPVIFSSEYYRRDKTVGILLQGFHITAGLDFDHMLKWPFTLYGRYGHYFMERYKKFSEDREISRVTAGIKINMFNISYLKLEYIRYITAYDEFRESDYYGSDLFYIQLMITF